MGCDIAVYKTKELSRDASKGIVVLERTELLDTKSWELGELMPAVPNGCTTTVDPSEVIEALEAFQPDDDDMIEEIQSCKTELAAIIQSKIDGTWPSDTVSLNVWY